MCINDEMGKQPVGDSRTQTVAEIWNGEPLQAIRRTHIRGGGVKAYEPCRACYQPRKTVKVPISIGERTFTLDELAGRASAIGQ